MALILPRLKEITFVFKLISPSFIFKCLRDDLSSSVIHHWNCKLKPYFFILVLWHWFCPDLKKSSILFSSLHVLVSFLSVLEMTCTQVWYIIGIVSSSPTDFQSEKIGLIKFTNYLPVSNRVKRVFWSEMKSVGKIKRYCHLGMAKIRLFYSGAMAVVT